VDKKIILTNFIDNMEAVRIDLGFSQSRMASELGLSLSGYKKIISGETGKIDIYLGCMLYQLSGKYLLELCGIRDHGLEIVRKLPKLSEAQMKFVNEVVSFEAAFAPKKDDKEDYITMMIPSGNCEDGMFWDSVDLKMINVAAYRKRFGEELHCALKVTSENLSPVYHEGDVLLISRQAPRDGEIGIFVNRDTGRGYIRKLCKSTPLRLEPVNGYGQTIILENRETFENGNWIRFGKVLSKMR